jgi:RHS repeat-associated protein
MKHLLEKGPTPLGRTIMSNMGIDPDSFIGGIREGIEQTKQEEQTPVEIHFYHCDHLGTPIALTDRNGKIVWAARYDPWGNIEEEFNPHNIEQNIRLPGQHHDRETGLHYNRHRYYDPKIGAYINQDPIGLLGRDANFYRYVQGNPIMAVDSLGLETCLLTTVGPGGIRDHSAVYTSRGDGSGGAVLYDPAGSYGAANGGGSAGIVVGDAANIEKFKNFHKNQTVELTCKNTSQEEEESIIDKAMDLPSAAPFQCASMSSTALSGQPSFPHVKAGTFWPGNLQRQARKGP